MRIKRNLSAKNAFFGVADALSYGILGTLHPHKAYNRTRQQ